MLLFPGSCLSYLVMRHECKHMDDKGGSLNRSISCYLRGLPVYSKLQLSCRSFAHCHIRHCKDVTQVTLFVWLHHDVIGSLRSDEAARMLIAVTLWTRYANGLRTMIGSSMLCFSVSSEGEMVGRQSPINASA